MGWRTLRLRRQLSDRLGLGQGKDAVSEDERQERKIDWPPPREDPEEEPSEPWAREPREGDKPPDWIGRP